MSRDDERKLVESFLVKGMYPDEEVFAITDRLSTRRAAQLSSATFAEAFDRRYPDSDPTRDDISAYAQRLVATYGTNESRVKPLVVETLMRAQAGEAELIRDLDAKDIVPHQILVAYDLFSALDLDEDGLNEFVAATLDLADQPSST